MKFLRLDLRKFLMLVVLLAILLAPVAIWRTSENWSTNHAPNSFLLLSPNGKKLLVDTGDGHCEIWDIDRQRKEVTRKSFSLGLLFRKSTSSEQPVKILDDGRLIVEVKRMFGGGYFRMLRPTNEGTFDVDYDPSRFDPARVQLGIEQARAFENEVDPFLKVVSRGYLLMITNDRGKRIGVPSEATACDLQSGNSRQLSLTFGTNGWGPEQLATRYLWRTKSGADRWIREPQSQTEKIAFDESGKEVNRITTDYYQRLKHSPNFRFFVGQSSAATNDGRSADLGLLDVNLRTVLSPVSSRNTFSTNDERFAFAEADGTITILNTATGAKIKEFHVNGDSPLKAYAPRTMVMDKKGRTLAIEDNYQIQIWNTLTGELIHDTEKRPLEFPLPAMSAALIGWAIGFGRWCYAPINSSWTTKLSWFIFGGFLLISGMANALTPFGNSMLHYLISSGFITFAVFCFALAFRRNKSRTPLETG